MPEVVQFKSFRDMPICAISQATTLYNKTGTWRNFRPVYENKTPPCHEACPTGEKIQGYIDLVTQGKLKEAWYLIMQDNPFPAVCGRVCVHFCEAKCNRGQYDKPIAIHHIERFIGDYGLKHRLNVRKPNLDNREEVAIIGGGPAGLSCAYQLALKGVRSTIFEAANSLGGMLKYGIPSYRLPKSILQKEIDRIIRLGVEVKTNIKVGKDIPFEDISKKYQAVFIGTGAGKERQLNIPGEKAEGVISALEFLHNLNAGIKPILGKKVAIIGGGNTAIDAARSALRLGATPIIIYRRTRNEMPAIVEEVSDAEEEKIEFIFLAAPVRIITKHNKVVALECIRMRLGSPDETGRPRAIPIKHSNFTVEVDTVIPAIGELPDLSFLPPELVAEKDKNQIEIDDFGATKLKGIFAGGDIVTGPRTVVEAIGAGKRAAFGIIQYLKGIKLPLEEKKVTITRFEDLNLAYFQPAERVAPFKLPPTQRKKNFREVYQTYTKNQAYKEAFRCFSCGVCNKCDNCFVFCPDMSVVKKNGKYEFDYDYCKGCGICAVECPRQAISIIVEEKLYDSQKL